MSSSFNKIAASPIICQHAILWTWHRFQLSVPYIRLTTHRCWLIAIRTLCPCSPRGTDRLISTRKFQLADEHLVHNFRTSLVWIVGPDVACLTVANCPLSPLSPLTLIGHVQTGGKKVFLFCMPEVKATVWELRRSFIGGEWKSSTFGL